MNKNESQILCMQYQYKKQREKDRKQPAKL